MAAVLSPRHTRSVARFEDVCAARLVVRQLPPAGLAALRRELAALAEEPAGSRARSLLARLLDRRLLTLEQAQWVHAGVERTKRARGLGLYLGLLEREGVPRGDLLRLVERLGRDADLDGLGQAILGAWRFPPERERQLRFQARLALERDLVEQARLQLPEALGGEGAPGPGPAPQAAPEPPPVVSESGKVRLDEALRPEEAQRILRRTLSDAEGDLPGPRFKIPAWVDMSDPRVGKLVAGYRLIGKIGAGAMGEVYLADRQEEPDRPVALKILPRGASSEAKARFKREILAQSFFSHRSVIDVYDAGETEGGDPWLAMEFLDARDLETLLEDSGRPLPPRSAALVAAQVLRGLAAAHAAKVVHRDVKPANVLVTPDLETAKLMDFGIAVVGDLGQFEGQVFRSLEGSVTGTPEYMSPEQAGGEQVGPPGDVYSLGCVLYRALSGRLPWESETSQGFLSCHLLEEPTPLGKVTRGLPAELDALLGRMLSKDPAGRPKATQAARELESLAPRLKRAPRGGQGASGPGASSGFSLRGLFGWR